MKYVKTFIIIAIHELLLNFSYKLFKKKLMNKVIRLKNNIPLFFLENVSWKLNMN